MCGCYNIAFDTITDGKFLYVEPMGKILKFDNATKIYNKSIKSIGYEYNEIIFTTILDEIEVERNHNEISLCFVNLYKNYNDFL
jgi:hypothetical protein